MQNIWLRLFLCLGLGLPLIEATPMLSGNSTGRLMTFEEPTGVKCAPVKIFADPRPRTTDCLQAILHVPEEHEPGNFQHGGPKTPYSLPLNRDFGTCRISIDMDPGPPSESSWQNIRHVATTVVTVCEVGQQTANSRTGGWVLTGEPAAINVTITGVPRRHLLDPSLSNDPGAFSNTSVIEVL